MAPRLFTCAAIAGALALDAVVAGIWVEDHRWGDTAGAFSTVAALLVIAGGFKAFWDE